MKVDIIGKNCCTITIENEGVILQSYATPVAFYDFHDGRIFVTSQKWSNTTSRHIKSFLKMFDNGCSICEVSQQEIHERIRI